MHATFDAVGGVPLSVFTAYQRPYSGNQAGHPRATVVLVEAAPASAAAAIGPTTPRRPALVNLALSSPVRTTPACHLRGVFP